MLALIARLPLLAALVLPLLGGALMGGVIWAWTEWVTIPHRLELQRVELVLEYEKKVAEAVAAEQRRQHAIIERLQTEFAERLAAELADQAQKIDQLETEIEAYEDAEGDTACRLDQGDLDFLLGLAAQRRQLQHDGAATGGR